MRKLFEYRDKFLSRDYFKKLTENSETEDEANDAFYEILAEKIAAVTETEYSYIGNDEFNLHLPSISSTIYFRNEKERDECIKTLEKYNNKLNDLFPRDLFPDKQVTGSKKGFWDGLVRADGEDWGFSLSETLRYAKFHKIDVEKLREYSRGKLLAKKVKI